jgi:dTDP-4-amino-4,6-dideoxygalactose transaminase
LNGIVDKYTWVDDGSSWVMSDILAAFLYGQLERFDEIFTKRVKIWDKYKQELSYWADNNNVAIPMYSSDVQHPGHIFFLRFMTKDIRDKFINYMQENGIQTPFHYQSLHETPYANRFNPNSCPNSSEASNTLVRLPIYFSLKEVEQNYIIEKIKKFN